MMKKILLVCLGLILVGGCAAKSKNTPIQAVSQFMEGLTGGDFNKLNQVMLVDEQIDESVLNVQDAIIKPSEFLKYWFDPTFEIQHEEIKGGSAWVTLVVKCIDSESLQSKMKVNLNHDEMVTLMNESEKIEKTITVYCVRLNNEWKIDSLLGNNKTLMGDLMK